MHDLRRITDRLNDLSLDINSMQRLNGHGDCVGWSMGGSPFLPRCGCGMPFEGMIAAAQAEREAAEGDRIAGIFNPRGQSWLR